MGFSKEASLTEARRVGWDVAAHRRGAWRGPGGVSGLLQWRWRVVAIPILLL